MLREPNAMLNWFVPRQRACCLLCSLLIAIASVGCSGKHPQQIQASAEQQKKWEDEENAESQRKLEEARARGDIR